MSASMTLQTVKPGLLWNKNCRPWPDDQEEIEMSSNAASALKREKDLLEQMLTLAECQSDLLESGRIEDLEVLLALRAGPLSELAAMEESAEAEMDQMQTASAEELHDVNELNLAILGLIDRLVNIDEKTELAAEHCGDCVASELAAEPGM
jgi:hypothetical protein